MPILPYTEIPGYCAQQYIHGNLTDEVVANLHEIGAPVSRSLVDQRSEANIVDDVELRYPDLRPHIVMAAIRSAVLPRMVAHADGSYSLDVRRTGPPAVE